MAFFLSLYSIVCYSLSGLLPLSGTNAKGCYTEQKRAAKLVFSSFSMVQTRLLVSKNKYNATDYNNPKSKGDCSENKSEQSLNLY